MRDKYYLPWDIEGSDVETRLALYVLCENIAEHSNKPYSAIKEALYRLIGYLCRG